MKLTEDQLYIQTFADKTLEMGCLLSNSSRRLLRYIGKKYNRYNGVEVGIMWLDDGFEIVKGDENNVEILGMPVTYSRLVYLYNIAYLRIESKEIGMRMRGEYQKLDTQFMKNPEELNKDVLTWSDDTIKVVKEFLDSLPKE